jgi:bis(5'-adenosyl)-triphosphatase
MFIPKRVVPRLQELTSDEVTDLFACVHAAVPVLEGHYEAVASNVAIQDGYYAGKLILFGCGIWL